MSDPYRDREVTVTIKVPESKKYAGDAPWFVFRGTVDAVSEQIGQTFGIAIAGLTLADVTINAQRLATNLNSMAQALGGTIIPSKDDNDSPPWDTSSAVSKNDVWQKAAEKQEKVDPILAGIEAATTVADLQQHWAENQEKFNQNAEYMSAYKTKGKALS